MSIHDRLVEQAFIRHELAQRASAARGAGKQSGPYTPALREGRIRGSRSSPPAVRRVAVLGRLPL